MKTITKWVPIAIAFALWPVLALAQNLFVSAGGNTIYGLTPGGARSAFAGGFIPLGLTFDSEGHLFAASGSAGNIYKFAPDGTRSTFASGLNFPRDLAFDRAGNLFVTTAVGVIYELSPGGARRSFGVAGGFDPTGLAFDAAGNLFVADYNGGNIYKFTPSGAHSVFASSLNPKGLAFDHAGNLFAADHIAGIIYEYAPDGARRTFASGVANIFGLAFDGRGNLFATSFSGGYIYEFASDGTRSTFASGLHSATSLAFQIPANAPPSVTCAGNSTAECGTTTSVSALVSDADADNLIVVWFLNGSAVQTNAVAGSTSPRGTNVSFSAVLPLGTNVLAVTVSDAFSKSATCSTLIQVLDTTAPVIHSITADPKVLWLPNHKMVPIRLDAIVTDACGPATWKIIGVTINEAADAKGRGDTSPDWEITGDHTLILRAERSGKGSGRVYTITIQATDLSGNTSQGAVMVTAPRGTGG